MKIEKNLLRKCKMRTLRIKDSQIEKIRQLGINLNKKLVQLGKQPLKDSEITHELLNQALDRAGIDDKGEITIKNK